MKDHLKEGLEKYISYVKSKFAYGVMEKQQIARTNIELIELNDTKVDTKLLVKNNSYHDLYNKVYFKVAAKYLVAGERLKQKDIKNIRYKLFTIKEITKMFGNSIDVFYNGTKIPYNEIRVALYDFCFVVELPIKYRNHITLNVLLRPYVYDEIFTSNDIIINKADINQIDDNDDFFFYVDGKQVNPDKLSIVEDADKYNIKSSVIGTTYEINYIRHLNYYGATKIKNNHIDLMNVRKAFPIPAHNIITFSNGLLNNLELSAKTDGIYQCGMGIPNYIDVYYVYRDYDNEHFDYNDQYRWFANYISNFMDIVDSPTLLPEFINQFKLYRRDISLQDFLAKFYNDMKTYNIDVANDTISNFCEECLLDIIKYIVAEYNADNELSVTSEFTNIGLLGKSTLLRNDNHSEILTPEFRAEFNLPMLVLKIPNIEEYPYTIYVDGERFYDHDVKYRELGVDYVYIDYNKISETANIEIEKVSTRFNAYREYIIVSDGTDMISVYNAKGTTGLIDSEKEIQYLTLAKSTSDNRFINSDNILNIEYDNVNDIVNIKLKSAYNANDIIKVYNINFYKKHKYTTRTEGSGIDVDLTWLDGCIANTEYIRIFKNGKEVPRSHYNIIYPSETNTLISPALHIDVSYMIYELIEVDYSSTRFKELYFKDRLLKDGIVDLLNVPDCTDKYLDNNNNQYFTLMVEELIKITVNIGVQKE